MDQKDEKMVKILYTNWRGENRNRTITPIEGGLYYGTSQWHTTPQWLLKAIDGETGETRCFAMDNVSQWNA
jgi:predicted DNA-binding transcriptional regulator YafY